MGSRTTAPRRLLRPRRLPARAIAPSAVALAAALLGGGGASAGAASAPAPSYAALDASGPTGLTLTDGRASSASPGPAWPASPPAVTGGPWPVTSSIRRLDPAVPGVSAWIARSAAGGVCVLVYDGRRFEGMGAVAATCSTPEAVDRGASLEISEIPGEPGRVIEAGVEPDGVSAVSTTLADGTSVTTPVEGDAWVRSGNQPAAPGSEPTAITGG